MEWRQGELFPRVGFIVTNLTYPTIGIVRFYNGRGTAEQWIKEGMYALNWTRMIKTGGRLVRHARRLVFQLAEVLVSREMLGGILERIGRLRLAPG